MTGLLSAAAEHFGLTVAGSAAWGWRDRSAGAPAAGTDGPRWLRVVTEDIRWAHGDWWTGNSDANVINGITKPAVLGTAEWEEGPRRIRAEVMTLVSGHPCSPTDILLTAELGLPRQWWLELDAATLYCYSLLMPATAQRVHDTFRDVLSSPQGTIAQLYACTRLLSRAERGDHPELSPLPHRHGEQLVRALTL
jgi:hypothetical protein